MKKSFLAMLLLLTLVAPVALGEAATPAPTSPITNFHEIWNIPWDVEYEEFAALAKENAGILFELETEGETSASYMALPEQSLTMFTYPVTITAYFSTETKQLTSMRFEFFAPNTVTETNYAYAMLASLFHDLSNRYGSPTHAYFDRYNEKFEPILFALPFKGNTLDVETLRGIGMHSEEPPLIRVFYDNVFLVAVFYPYISKLHATVRIEAFSPAKKDLSYNIPETNIHPWEQYDAIMSTPLPATPTPVPQIDVGL